MSVVVMKNTYPEFPNTAHAKAGDLCEWSLERGCFNLIRLADDKVVFATPTVDREGLKANGQPPTLVGVVARVKSKNYVLEVSRIPGTRARR